MLSQENLGRQAVPVFSCAGKGEREGGTSAEQFNPVG